MHKWATSLSQIYGMHFNDDDSDDGGDDDAQIEWGRECRFSGVRGGYGCVVGAWGCLGLLWISLNCLGLHLIV